MGDEMNIGDEGRYKLRAHLLSAAILHLVFEIPSFLLLIALGVFDPEFAVILFILFFLVSPIAGLLTWMIDRGSRGENSLVAIRILGGIPGRIYGFMIGGILGNYLAGAIGIVLGIILFYLIGRYVGFRYGSSLSLRIAEHFS